MPKGIAGTFVTFSTSLFQQISHHCFLDQESKNIKKKHEIILFKTRTF